MNLIVEKNHNKEIKKNQISLTINNTQYYYVFNSKENYDNVKAYLTNPTGLIEEKKKKAKSDLEYIEKVILKSPGKYKNIFHVEHEHHHSTADLGDVNKNNIRNKLKGKISKHFTWGDFIKPSRQRKRYYLELDGKKVYKIDDKKTGKKRNVKKSDKNNNNEAAKYEIVYSGSPKSDKQLRQIKEIAQQLDKIQDFITSNSSSLSLKNNIIKTASGYRGEHYNAAVGGKGHSHHLKTAAVDFYTSADDKQKLFLITRALMKYNIIDKGYTQYYPDSKENIHVHYDYHTRNNVMSHNTSNKQFNDLIKEKKYKSYYKNFLNEI